MQRIVEKWVYAAAIIPNGKNPDQALKQRGIPRSEWSWIKGLRGHNIHNAAAGVMDYRTGEVLAYMGSASYTAKGSKKMQPQFDVLSTGYRQPGSSIKPLIYLIGIDDKTMTALKKANPGYNRLIIKAGTYPKQTADVPVIGYSTHVVAACDLPENTVYQMTKAMAGNISGMAAVVKAIDGVTPKDMALDIGVPFHKGAAKFYKEVGAL